MFKFIKRFFFTMLILVLTVAIMYNYARYIEPNMLKEKDVEVSASFTAPEVQEFIIALFSDTHFSEYYTLEDFAKVVSAINSKNPDIVIFAGDLIDKFNTYEGDTDHISNALSTINSKYGKFAIFGNHDYGGGAERYYKGIMENGGFTVLKNEYTAIDALGVGIIGIDDYLIGYGQSDIATWAREDYYNIAISHVPDIMDEVLNNNIDIMLAGHTHGGQVNIPFIVDQFLPTMGKKYPRGLYKFENQRKSSLYVTPGLGTTQIPLRFRSMPEVTFITIKK